MIAEQQKEIALEEFRAADATLADLAKFADITWTNPINGPEERKKFFSQFRRGKRYNPHYRYVRSEESLAKAESLLSAMNFEQDALGRLFSDLVAETWKRIQLTDSVGRDDFTDKSIAVYGLPSECLIQQAKRILQIVPPDSETDQKSFSADDLADMLAKEIERYHAQWTIEITDRASAKVNVIPSLAKIEIKRGEEFSEPEAKRLIVHEINAHFLRAVNGGMQPFKIFVTGLADSERTDEGFATIVEEITGLIKNRTFRLYAGRVIGASLSQTKCFYDVFSELLNDFSEEDAFYITQRVKRGLSDTSQGGGFIKDYIYLDGREQVKQYLQADGAIDVLYCGNTSIKDAGLIRELIALGIVKPPKYLPWFVDNKKKDLFASLKVFDD